MKLNRQLLALGLLAALAGTAGAQDQKSAEAKALTEAEVRVQLNAEGYIDIQDLELVDGTWTAEVKRAEGPSQKVHIDSETGSAFVEGTKPPLDATEIEDALETAGYTNVHELKLDGGFWQAEAEDSKGESVQVQVHPTTGKVTVDEGD